QLDLLFSKRTNFFSVNCNSAYKLVILEHRDEDESPAAAQLDGGHRVSIAVDVTLLGHCIDDMHGLPRAHGAAETAGGSRMNRPPLLKFGKRRGSVPKRNSSKRPFLEQVENSKSRLAKPGGVIQHRMEYRAKLAGRRTDRP